MKKYIYLIFFLLFFVAAFKGPAAVAQEPNGGIVTLRGDTIPCTIAKSPKDVGLRRQRIAYRYDYIIAIFKNDSVRVIHPGTIKAFFVNWEPEYTSPTSWYVSDTINETHNVLIKNPRLVRPVFLQKLVYEGYYHLWFFEEFYHGQRNDRIFILEESSTGNRSYFYTTKQLKKLLGLPTNSKKKSKDRNWFKDKQLLVIEYNKSKG